MYNRWHGLENHESRRLRCVRTLLDSAGGAPSTVRQPKVPFNAVGSGRGGWKNAGGEG
jgi:hypothetical protein